MNTDTYIISLSYPQNLIEYTKNVDLNPIHVQAVNGKTVTKSQIEKHTTPLWAILGPKGAIGCALSHLLCWKKISQSDKDFAVILEDDVYFSDDFEKQFKSGLQHVPQDFDILYIGCHCCDKNSHFAKLMKFTGKSRSYQNINDYIEIPSVALATHAYIISKKGAQKLVQLLDGKISYNIDERLNSLMVDDKIIVYKLKKLIAFQTSNIDNNSSITTSSHPFLLNYPLSKIIIDNEVSLKYAVNCPIARVNNNTNLNILSILWFLTGLLFRIYNIKLQTALIIFFIISISDLFNIKQIGQVFFHLLLFMIPYILTIRKNNFR